MKKLNRIIVVAVGLLLAPLSLAAFVETHTPGGINPESYTILTGGTPDQVYSNMVSGDHSALVTDEANGGHELIYLGLHTAFEVGAGGELGLSDQITVNLNNTSGGTTTGSVSLVLSAVAAVNWTVNLGDGVQLENIYWFSGNAENRANSMVTVVNGTANVEGSIEDACGYNLPQDNEGCNIGHILGVDDPLLGFAVNDFLGDLTGLLDVTNFNGTYHVSQFDVNIDSVVVPLPAAGGLFAAALALLQMQARRRTHRLS